MIDEPLWRACKKLLAGQKKPSERNRLIGQYDGDDVYLSDFDWYMVNAGMMDIHEGMNSVEDPKVKPKGAHVDYQMAAHNWPFILYHELIEMREMRRLMKGGMGLNKAYDKAHELANKHEKALRIREKVGT